MDVLTKEQRRKNMQAIKSKNTGIEVKLGKAMWSEGLRYRKNDKSVIGKPDFTFKRKKIAIFCDSEFWHGKDWEDIKQKRLKENRNYWITKIERNIKRDNEVNQKLRNEGWTVLRFWGKNISKNLTECIDIIKNEIKKKVQNSK